MGTWLEGGMEVAREQRLQALSVPARLLSVQYLGSALVVLDCRDAMYSSRILERFYCD
jgi:hypothetical protein